ncbi:hypothetical protein GLOIN_2v1498765, partial [Rhizophagus irregularis DAOM 181602=DAOM 197198]
MHIYFVYLINLLVLSTTFIYAFAIAPENEKVEIYVIFSLVMIFCQVLYYSIYGVGKKRGYEV